MIPDDGASLIGSFFAQCLTISTLHIGAQVFERQAGVPTADSGAT